MENQPQFIEVLPGADSDEYQRLRLSLNGASDDMLKSSLDAIRGFCIRQQHDDWQRCLVCGICWLLNGNIAINYRSLRILLNMSKSRFNSAMQRIGYVTVPNRVMELIRMIPYLEKNEDRLRDWTIKEFVPGTPKPTVPVFKEMNQHWHSSSPTPEIPQFQPISVQELKRIDRKSLENSFYDDPFSLPPIFLFGEDFT